MQSYEFYATTEDGYIRIPDEYKTKIGQRIKVVILEDEEAQTSIRDILLPPTLNTNTFNFDREEANER